MSLWRCSTPEEESRLHLLTPSEMAVLHWVAEAKTNASIAIIMGRSEGTIRTHVQNILHKLQVENRVAAVIHYLHFTGRLRNYA
ncbi:MAG: response regulator transcription factor [Chthoniobacterales bacterium]